MKAKDIREMSEVELNKKLDDLKEELFNLRFQHATGQMSNTSVLGQVKKDIARVKTVMRERALAAK